jgi:hypothetical protein
MSKAQQGNTNMPETTKQATQEHGLHYMFVSGHRHTSLVAHLASSSKHADRSTIQQENSPTQSNAKLLYSACYERRLRDSIRAGCLIS